MIRIQNLTIGYGKHILLKNANADINAGQLTALIGRNGTGKSTLLRVLAGLIKPYEGRVLLNGKDLSAYSSLQLASMVSVVTTQSVRIPNLTCSEVVALGRAPYTNWIGKLGKEDRTAIRSALRLTDMERFEGRTMDTMSDGECQRIMIARAIAQNTPVILLDEPTAFLDLPNRYEICLLLRNLAAKEGKCIVFSTHELDIALELSRHIFLIDPPNLYSQPTKNMIESGIIERLFHNRNIRFDALQRKVCLPKDEI